jgi:hypothetical protein
MDEAATVRQVKQLLMTARNICRYEQEIERATGAGFNLFDILQIGHLEVKTHSPILAELLNPAGSHRQGAIFLRHFLNVVGIDGFDADSARVASEVGIGDLGRLDIEIVSKTGARIIIENKIGAVLQNKQLERYHQYDPNAFLLFLTLNGDDPETNKQRVSDIFDGKLIVISYSQHILRWLNECRKEVATIPTVREAITQYIHLLQKLTQQNISARMNEELLNTILKDKDTYMAYAALRNANWEVRRKLIERVNRQIDATAKHLNCKVINLFECNGKRYEGAFITTAFLESHNLKFGLESQTPDYRDFCYGFAYIGQVSPSPLIELLQSEFKTKFGNFSTSNSWPACPWWTQHRNWDDTLMSEIIAGEFFGELSDLLTQLAYTAETVRLKFEK